MQTVHRSFLARLGARSIEIPLDESDLPTAFRLFKAGENETTKGVFLFDDAAAKAVMNKATAHGVDLMVDLEHLSLDTESRSYDPDARAWLNLELRDGALWATNVRWTEDGARRLTQKTQRYISPAFLTDDDNRVIEIVNIALTALPATYDTPALVAASRRSAPMTESEKFKHMLAARVSIAKGKIAKLADGAPADGADGGGDAAGKFAAVQDAAKQAMDALAALDKVKDVDQAMSAAAAAVAACEAVEAAVAAMTGTQAPADPAPAGDPAAAGGAQAAEEKKMNARDRAELIELRRRAEKEDEDRRVTALAAEMAERHSLEAELVKLGRETPASIVDLADMPIAKLRARVEKFRALPPVVGLGGPKSPAGAGGGAGEGSQTIVTRSGMSVTLTANQLRECERAGAKPEAFAELQVSRQITSKG